MQRPLVSFGPRASAKLRTSPISVCKVTLNGIYLSLFPFLGALMNLLFSFFIYFLNEKNDYLHVDLCKYLYLLTIKEKKIFSILF